MRAALTGKSHVLQQLLDSCLDIEPEKYESALRRASQDCPRRGTHTSLAEALSLVRGYHCRIELIPLLRHLPSVRTGAGVTYEGRLPSRESEGLNSTTDIHTFG